MDVNHTQARARSVVESVGQGGLIAGEFIEFVVGFEVDVRGELLGLGGGDVVDLGAGDRDFDVFFCGAEHGLEEGDV